MGDPVIRRGNSFPGFVLDLPNRYHLPGRTKPLERKGKIPIKSELLNLR